LDLSAVAWNLLYFILKSKGVYALSPFSLIVLEIANFNGSIQFLRNDFFYWIFRCQSGQFARERLVTDCKFPTLKWYVEIRLLSVHSSPPKFFLGKWLPFCKNKITEPWYSSFTETYKMSPDIFQCLRKYVLFEICTFFQDLLILD